MSHFKDFQVNTSDCKDTLARISASFKAARTRMVRSYLALQGVAEEVEDPAFKQQAEKTMARLALIIATIDGGEDL